MVKFKYGDTEKTFETWYEAADWFYYMYESEDTDVNRVINSSRDYFTTFANYVNDCYSAYDILARAKEGLYAHIYEEFICELADDLEDDVYDFCVFFTEEK